MLWQRLRPQLLLLSPAILVVLIAFLIPVLLIVTRAFEGGWGAYENLLTPVFLGITIRTIGVAALVALVSLLIAYPVAYFITTLPSKAARILIGFIGASLFVSIIVRGYTWLALLDRGGVLDSMFAGEVVLLRTLLAVVLGLVQYGVPLMMFPIYNSMRQVDPRLRKAAVSLGASPARAFWSVYFPQTLHGVVAGFTVVFVVVLGYYILPAILGGPRNTMLGEYVATQFLSNANFETGSAAAFLLLVAAFAAYLVIRGVGRLLIKG